MAGLGEHASCKRERAVLLKRLDEHKQAIAALLQDRMRRHISDTGASYAVQTNAGARIDPRWCEDHPEVMQVLQRACEELDRAHAKGQRIDFRETSRG